MNNYVTFKTAVKLEEAGFPRPEKASFGNVFYDKRGNEIVIVNAAPAAKVTYVVKGEAICYSKPSIPKKWIFAPTAADILEKFSGVDLVVCSADRWEVWLSRNLCSAEENPAEASATAWMYKTMDL